MKLIDKQNRLTLNEGRNYQMGFAFCRKVDPETYETVQPISACKDYLNDVYAGEILQKEIGAYGLHFKPSAPIFSKTKAYMAFKILPNQHGGPYQNMDKDVQNLTTNIGKVQKFINNFEELFKIETKSTIKPLDNDTFLVSFSRDWLKGIYAVSLFALLLRVSQWYDGEQDVMEYLSNFKQFAPDVYLISGNLAKIKYLVENGLTQEDLEIYRNGNGYDVHNNGIHTVKMEALKSKK